MSETDHGFIASKSFICGGFRFGFLANRKHNLSIDSNGKFVGIAGSSRINPTYVQLTANIMLTYSKHVTFGIKKATEVAF
ncbi:hypothetical protein CMT41_06685 [Colwellia sp. MT41]|nr:hypothetical protein CMT41_06685 [Colwellia sp. MT41]